MPWPQTGAIHSHAQLDLSDKGPATKGMVVCYVVWLGSMKRIGLRTCSKCAGLDPCCGQDRFRSQVLQQTIETQHNSMHI